MAFTNVAKPTASFTIAEKPKHGSVAKFGTAQFGKARFGRVDVGWKNTAKPTASFTISPKPA